MGRQKRRAPPSERSGSSPAEKRRAKSVRPTVILAHGCKKSEWQSMSSIYIHGLPDDMKDTSSFVDFLERKIWCLPHRRGRRHYFAAKPILECSLLHRGKTCAFLNLHSMQETTDILKLNGCFYQGSKISVELCRAVKVYTSTRDAGSCDGDTASETDDDDMESEDGDRITPLNLSPLKRSKVDHVAEIDRSTGNNEDVKTEQFQVQAKVSMPLKSERTPCPSTDLDTSSVQKTINEQPSEDAVAECHKLFAESTPPLKQDRETAQGFAGESDNISKLAWASIGQQTKTLANILDHTKREVKKDHRDTRIKLVGLQRPKPAEQVVPENRREIAERKFNETYVETDCYKDALIGDLQRRLQSIREQYDKDKAEREEAMTKAKETIGALRHELDEERTNHEMELSFRSASGGKSCDSPAFDLIKAEKEKCASLQKQNRDLQDELTAARSSLSAVRADLLALQTKHESCDKDLAISRSDVDRAEAKVRLLRVKLQQLQGQRQQVQSHNQRRDYHHNHHSDASASADNNNNGNNMNDQVAELRRELAERDKIYLKVSSSLALQTSEFAKERQARREVEDALDAERRRRRDAEDELGNYVMRASANPSPCWRV